MPRTLRSLRRARTVVRGASLVEYMVILGVVVLLGAGAFSAFGGDVSSAATREGGCVQSLTADCAGASGVDLGAEASGAAGASASSGGAITAEGSRELRDQAQAAFTELDDPVNPPTGERARELQAYIEAVSAHLSAAETAAWRAGDSELGLALAEDAMVVDGLARRSRERTFQVVQAEKPLSRAVVEFGKGVLVDGAWGTVVGIWTAVSNPIDTAVGIWTITTNPIDTYNVVSEHIATQWEENPSRLTGAIVFEVATLVVAPAKVGKVGKVGELAEHGAEVGGVARRVLPDIEVRGRLTPEGRSITLLSPDTVIYRVQDPALPMLPHPSPYFDSLHYGLGVSNWDVIYVSADRAFLEELRAGQGYFEEGATLHVTTLGELVEASGEGTRVFVDERLGEPSYVIVRPRPPVTPPPTTP